ncbi:MAG TPA: AAA family ATPase [Blastocatellia bacterium]|jgi:general secretion pathway protein A|nr:AAA family ATPase [Blastocatellia bacterium]
MKAYKFFGLRENCFSPSPNPRYLSMTDQTNACLFKCRFVIEERQGLAAIIGKIGFGKTSVLRYLVDQYIDDEAYKIAMLPNCNFPSEMQLAKAICEEFGLKRRRSLTSQLQELRDFAFESYMQGKNVILVIDEAQQLRGPQFDLLREILNYETNEAKVIQIIIAGQPEIELKLQTKPALVSRIILTSYLDTFTVEDMKMALAHRLSLAGGTLQNILSDGAFGPLYIASRGVPRDIVKLVNSSMLLAAINQTKPISPEIVELAVAENLKQQPEEDVNGSRTEKAAELRSSAAS